ncbi:MAG: hypothetical protein VZQ83_03905 [Eubacterium sp.]|nr:hypothetical protein [Eubacterium sp.]
MKKKILVCMLTAMMALGLAACGSDSSAPASDDTSSDVTTDAGSTDTTDAGTTDAGTTEEAFSMDGAKEETWGDLTVSVPAGYEFKKGDALDEKDTRFCSVRKNDFHYIDFKMEDDDVCQQQYEYNKKTYTNEQKDITGTYADIAWTGFEYGDGLGGKGFEAYAKVNGKNLRISGASVAFDSEEAKAILGSVKVK